jgi:hypothetical protein
VKVARIGHKIQTLRLRAHLSPWERLDGLDSRNEIQLLQEHPGPFLEVHGIYMDAMDVQVGVEDRPAHICHELNAELSDFLVVVLDRLQDIQEVLGDDGVGHPGGLLETVPVLNGHDARDDRNGDTGLPNGLDPTDEEVHVKEHLGEDPGATEVGFRFEVPELFPEQLRGEEDMFWEARDSDIEVVVVVLLNMSDEVDPMDKASVDGLPNLFSSWRVPSKSENIATTVLLSGLGQENALVFRRRWEMVGTHREGYVNFFWLHVGAGEMHACLETNRSLAKLDHLRREFGGTSSGVPENA